MKTVWKRIHTEVWCALWSLPSTKGKECWDPAAPGKCKNQTLKPWLQCKKQKFHEQLHLMFVSSPSATQGWLEKMKVLTKGRIQHFFWECFWTALLLRRLRLSPLIFTQLLEVCLRLQHETHRGWLSTNALLGHEGEHPKPKQSGTRSSFSPSLVARVLWLEAQLKVMDSSCVHNFFVPTPILPDAFTSHLHHGLCLTCSLVGTTCYLYLQKEGKTHENTTWKHIMRM